MINNMRLFKISLLLIVFLLAAPAFAQLDTGFLPDGQTSLLTDPAFPKPGELVTVTIESYGSNIYNSNIVWRFDGEIIASATNQRSAQIKAGDLGESAVVSASLVNSAGTERLYSTTIEPRYIDIVVEPQTRVPDFFEGRAVPSIGSAVNVTALIDNNSSDKARLVYTWRLNNKVLEGGPIRSRNQTSFEMPRGKDATLSVEIASTDGEILGRRAVVIQSTRPELHFYNSNALYGPSHNSIVNTLILFGSSATIQAEPYYLDSRVYNSPDIIEWEIDGQTTSLGSANPYEITVQKIQEGGASRLNFHVRSTSEILQGAEDNIDITF